MEFTWRSGKHERKENTEQESVLVHSVLDDDDDDRGDSRNNGCNLVDAHVFTSFQTVRVYGGRDAVEKGRRAQAFFSIVSRMTTIIGTMAVMIAAICFAFMFSPPFAVSVQRDGTITSWTR